MKKLTFLISSLFIGSAFAQTIPTLTQATSVPLAGEAYEFYTNPAAAGLSITHGGANETWDFSSVNGNPELTSYMTDANSPNPGVFPGCNLAEVSSLAENYLQTSSSAYSYVGQLLDVADITYTDPGDLLQFPITFGDSFTDVIAGTAEIPVIGIINASGTGVIKADGHGTLITSYGSIPNVLRIHVYQDIDLGAMGNLTNNFYFWYDQTHKVALASYVDLQNPLGASQVASVLSENDYVTSVQEATANSDLHVYPNPAQQQINVTNALIGQEVVILSISGQVIYSTTIQSSTENIDISSFPKGMYLLKVSSEVRQFVKSE